MILIHFLCKEPSSRGFLTFLYFTGTTLTIKRSLVTLQAQMAIFGEIYLELPSLC